MRKDLEKGGDVDSICGDNDFRINDFSINGYRNFRKIKR